MKRDVNGLQTALRRSRAQRLLVDTKSGTILGYADINGKTGDVRPQVYEALAGSRVAVLTIGEYLRLTRDDGQRECERKSIITAGEWYRSLDRGAEAMIASAAKQRFLQTI